MHIESLTAMGRRVYGRGWSGPLRVAALACLVGICGPSSVSAEAPPKGTLGFVVRDWFTSMYNSKFGDECPEGLVVSNDEIWWRALNKTDRARMTDNGLREVLARGGPAVHRGPNKEDVCFNPTIVKDPSMRTVEGKFSYGVNLDGTTDGHATAKSCAHQKFTGVDGTPGIDNQLYRMMGCVYGWRMSLGRHADLNANESRGTSGLAMILVEVTGVTDPRNSDNVTVTFYRSVDQYPQDSSGKPLPYSTYRVQLLPNGKARYGDSLKGSIKDGVLQTERGDVRLPFYGNYTFMNPVIKDMSLRMNIAADGGTADGQIAGYYEMDQWLYYLLGQGGVTTLGMSCPALYDAAHKLADGYPDPKTGECTAMSSAFDITAYSAFILHPPSEQKNAQR